MAAHLTRRRVIIATSIVAGLCILVVAIVLGSQLYRNSPGQRITRAMTSISQTDAQIAVVDDAISAQLSTETTAQVALARRAIPVAQRTLNDARAQLDALPDSAARKPATATRLARIHRCLDARLVLLAAAPPLLDETSQAATALACSAPAWQNLQDAAALTTAAEQEFARQTQDAMVSSHESSTQAADAYAQAQDQFNAAAQAYPATDFKDYIAYTQQRILMTQSALLGCEDWINGHYQDANTDVTAYNGFAQAAARIAGAGLQLPSDLVASTYQTQTKTAQLTYDNARAEVLRADAALR